MYRAKWFRDFISKQRLVSATFQKIIQKVSQTGIHLKSLAPISGFTRLLASQNGFVVNWVNCIVIQRCVCNTIALNCLVFEKIAFFCILATEKRTNRQTDCDVPRLDVLNTANLCPAVSVVGLFYLLTVIMNFVCLFIFRLRFHQKVPVCCMCVSDE